MAWDYDLLKWLLPTLILPLALLLGAIAIRTRAEIRLTAATDFMALIIVYDFAVLVDPSFVTEYVSAPDVQSSIMVVHLTFIIAGGLTWLWSIFWIEDRLETHHFWSKVSKEKLAQATLITEKGTSFPYVSWGLVWIVAFSVFVTHIAVLKS